MNKFYTIFIILSLVVRSSAQWVNLNTGINGGLNAISFNNINDGWVAGVNGQIYNTNDGGSTWNQQNSGITYTINSIYAVSPSIIVAVGIGNPSLGEGTILRSTDGGANWSIQTAERDLNSVFFITSQTGWAVGNGGRILRTGDAGVSWVNQNTGTYILEDVHFTNENNGFAIGGGKFLKTTNGGTDWIEETISAPTTLRTIYFTDANTGWVAGNSGYLIKTIDGGVNWTIQNSGTITTLEDIYFKNPNEGWCVGGAIIYTADGGSNWNTQLNGTINQQFSVSFIDDNTGWTCGNNGTVYKTTNGGITFIEGDSEIPEGFKLYQNYPNPFNPTTAISWQSPVGSHQTLKVYDVLGNEVATLVDEYNPAGSYEVEFDASSLSSGIYFYQLRAGSNSETKPMVLIK